MNTKTLETVVQQRVCYKLAFLEGDRGGHTLNEMNYEVTRICNRVLIERGLNNQLWSRVYRTRLFVYHMESRRAVLELGCITEDTGRVNSTGQRLYRGFTLVIMGGIHNNKVIDDLSQFVGAQPITRRVNQYAKHY